MCKAKRIGIKAKATTRKKGNVELVVKTRKNCVAFLVVESIYCGSAREWQELRKTLKKKEQGN